MSEVKRETTRVTVSAELPITAINPNRVPLPLRQMLAEVIGETFTEWMQMTYRGQQEAGEMLGDMSMVYQPRDGEVPCPMDVVVQVDYTIDGVFIKAGDEGIEVVGVG